MARTRQRQGSKVDLPSSTYGEGRQLQMMQDAAGGIAAPGPGAPPPSPDQARARRAAVLNTPVGGIEGVFGPTRRPGEPVTAGVPMGPGFGPPVDPADAQLALQAMYAVLPHPAIARLLRSDVT